MMNNNLPGFTGIDVSPITIGAWQLGGPLFFDGKPDGHPDPGKENVIRMIHELGDLGVNTICMGAKNIADYRAAIAAAELPPLSDEIRRALEATAARI